MEPSLNSEGNLTEQVRCLHQGHFVRAELRRHFLSERERLVAEALLEVSLFFGRPSVRIPKLEVIGDLTGIPRSHVHGALAALVEMRIVGMSEGDRCVVYAMNADSDCWKVKVRVAKATVRRAVELVAEINGTAAPANDGVMEGAIENFKVLPGTILNGAGVTDSGTVTEGEALIARARAVLAQAAKRSDQGEFHGSNYRLQN